MPPNSPPPPSNVDADAFALALKMAGAFLRRIPPAERSRFHDDIFSDAMYGLARANLDFHPEMGVPFTAYAAMRIRNEMIDGTRHRLGRSGNRRHVVLTTPGATDPDVYLDRLAGGVDDPAIAELDDAVAHARIINLAEWVIRADHPGRHDLFVFRERLKGRTQSEVGADIGLTGSRVSQIEKHMQHVLSRAGLERP